MKIFLVMQYMPKQQQQQQQQMIIFSREILHLCIIIIGLASIKKCHVQGQGPALQVNPA
jgi:hypothetical protein